MATVLSKTNKRDSAPALAHLSESAKHRLSYAFTPYPRMLRDECLVKLEKPERMTATKRLWIPDSAQREEFELYQGIVLAVGPGRLRKDGRVNPMELEPGDRVLFHWSAMKADVANVQWREDGDEIRIISEWQVQAHWPGNLTLEEALR